MKTLIKKEEQLETQERLLKLKREGMALTMLLKLSGQFRLLGYLNEALKGEHAVALSTVRASRRDLFDAGASPVLVEWVETYIRALICPYVETGLMKS